MKNRINFLLFSAILAIFAIALSPDATAQTGVVTYDEQAFVIDTLSGTTATICLWRNYSLFPNAYSWRIRFDELSGSATMTIKFQESEKLTPGTSASSTDWYTKQTISLTADKDTIYKFDLDYGRRVRAVITTTGTQTSLLFPTFTMKRQEGAY